MNKNGGKVVWISLSVVCFILLYSTVAFYVMEETEKGRKNTLQKKLDEISAVGQGLEAKCKESEALTVELKTRLKSQEDTIAEASRHLDEEKSANTANLLKLQARENEIRAMKTRLENANAEKEGILKNLDKANKDYLEMKAQAEHLKTKENMEKKAKEAVEREGVSLGTIVVDDKKN